MFKYRDYLKFWIFQSLRSYAMAAELSFTSVAVHLLNPASLRIPTSMLSSVICPSKLSIRVNMAVWMASSSSRSCIFSQGKFSHSHNSFPLLWLSRQSKLQMDLTDINTGVPHSNHKLVKKLHMDEHHLPGYILASQKLLSVPAELWAWVLGKQDSIAEPVFELCAQALRSLGPYCRRRDTPSLWVWWLVPLCVPFITQNGFLLLLSC